MAGRYLAERGHRDTALFPPAGAQHRRGLAGFMKVMEEALINVPDNWIVQGDFELKSGLPRDAANLSQSHALPPFSLRRRYMIRRFCAADEMGLRVPQTLAIGYDNVRNARYFTSPALTTIHQPSTLYETAFNMLLIASSISVKSHSSLKFIHR